MLTWKYVCSFLNFRIISQHKTCDTIFLIFSCQCLIYHRIKCYLLADQLRNYHYRQILHWPNPIAIRRKKPTKNYPGRNLRKKCLRRALALIIESCHVDITACQMSRAMCSRRRAPLTMWCHQTLLSIWLIFVIWLCNTLGIAFCKFLH